MGSTSDWPTMSKAVDVLDLLGVPNEAKVVFDKEKDALYFSRSPVPYVMEAEEADWLEHHTFYKHVGVYAYKMDVLRKITELPVSPLEATERLEQFIGLSSKAVQNEIELLEQQLKQVEGRIEKGVGECSICQKVFASATFSGCSW